MRILKFRAWDKKTKAMIAVGFDILGETTCFDLVGQYLFEHKEKYETTLGRLIDVEITQYTGLSDKNGKEIYEGDIIRMLYTDWCSQTDFSISFKDYKKSISRIGKVEYYGTEFIINFGQGKYWDDDRGSLFEGAHGEKEVIGNIYENTELIK